MTENVTEKQKRYNKIPHRAKANVEKTYPAQYNEMYGAVFSD